MQRIRFRNYFHSCIRKNDVLWISEFFVINLKNVFICNKTKRRCQCINSIWHFFFCIWIHQYKLKCGFNQNVIVKSQLSNNWFFLYEILFNRLEEKHRKKKKIDEPLCKLQVKRMSNQASFISADKSS